MKGKLIFLGEEWQLTSKNKQGKRTGDYVEVRDWTVSKVKKGVTEVTLVNGTKHTLIGHRKGGQVYRALGVTKDQIRSIRQK